LEEGGERPAREACDAVVDSGGGHVASKASPIHSPLSSTCPQPQPVLNLPTPTHPPPSAPWTPQDKSKPADWGKPENLTILPPESEVIAQPLDKVRLW